MGNPQRLLWAGGIGVVIGAVLPFLMVIRVFEPSLLLSLVSYLCSAGGLFLGVLGLAGITGQNRDEERFRERRRVLEG